MGYRALLFCPDDKLARVVSQVFSELDFAVDPVHEPFAAVKQLMAQHYEAIVVDCDNEQNASLLFRSARNSSSNQSSLAFALVEGQTGVAKAYRIGANLVLTKPINVEQAKGTLRIARGLLRKSAEAATAATPPMAAKAAAGASSGAATAVSAASAPRNAGWNELSPTSSPTASPTAATSVSVSGSTLQTSSPDAKTEITASAGTQNRIVIASEATDEKQASSSTIHSGRDTSATNSADAIKTSAKNDSPKTATSSGKTQDTGSASTSIPGSAAAAAAPAKQLTASSATEKKPVEAKPAGSSRSAATKGTVTSPGTSATSAKTTTAPSFGGLSEGAESASGRNKKILIAAVIVLALAAIVYFGDSKLTKFGARSPEPAARPADSSQPAPAVKPMSSPAEPPSTSAPNSAVSSAEPADHPNLTQAAADKPSAVTSDAGELRIAANIPANVRPTASNSAANSTATAKSASNSNPETRSSDSAPLLVKAKLRTQPQADESAPPPATLALASANDTNLSGLMAPASLNVSKPELATLKVSQGVSQGLLIKRVQPQYPQAALAIHAHGAVQIQATINKEGSVINPKVLKGDPVLAQSAIEAVRQWRYKPYYLDGAPVEIQTQITINFKAN